MKKLFLSSLVFAMALHATETAPEVSVESTEQKADEVIIAVIHETASEAPADPTEAPQTPAKAPADPTEEYRNKKAYEVIIHDSFYEAEKYKGEIPTAWKEALNAFGYKEDDIEFYTAVRTDNFVERVGNKLVILRPNFFLYCTPEEQKVYVGLRLASLRQGVEYDYGGSHETFCNTKKASISFRQKTMAATALGLMALYHKQFMAKTRQLMPTVKNVLFSHGAALVAGCWLLNKAKELVKKHDEIKQFNEAQLMVVDKLGAEGLISIREKQVNWSNDMAWWWQRKWYYALGKLALGYDSEASLELIQNYIAKKQTASN